MVNKGDLVSFKPGINGIEPPYNYGIFIARYRNKQKTNMVKIFTIKGNIEFKYSNMDKKSLGKSVQLKGANLPENKEMKKRLETWIKQMKAREDKLNEIEQTLGVLTEKRLWEKVRDTKELNFSSERLMEIWFEMPQSDIKKDKRKEFNQVLDGCRNYGQGYFDLEDKRWIPISNEDRKAAVSEISEYGNLRNRMFHIIEVPTEDDPEEYEKIRAPKPWDLIEFTAEDHTLIKKMQDNMAYFVENDRWADWGLGDTHIHALDDFSLRSYTSYLAEDWMNEGKTSFSDAFVKFLIRTEYWNDTDAIISISKRRVLLEKDFDWETPERIEEIASKYKEPKDTPGAFDNRTDFQALEAYTIDPPTAKDFDDAVSLINKKDRYILYVHIADVAHYVEKDSSLDLHARRRATSVYLPTKTLPMLPNHLSDNLCSLNEQLPRLAMTVEIHFDKEGNKLLDDCKVHNSVILVTKNLSYDIVNEAIENKEEPFLGLHLFSNILQTHRKGLKIQSDDVRLELGGQMSLTTKTASKSTSMIETFMVAANETVAEILQKEKLPVVYRNHPLPDKEDVIRFNVHAKVIGLDHEIVYPDLKDGEDEEEEGSSLMDLLSQGSGNISFSLGVGSSADEMRKSFAEKENDEEDEIDLGTPLANGLAQLEEGKREEILEPFRQALKKVEAIEDEYQQKLGYLIVLRTLSRALYAPGNMGHFGLGSTAYLHFTSPIRRYPDIIAHRVCKAMIANTEFAYDADEIADVAEHCTEQSEIAEKLERIIVGAGFSFLTRNPNYSENKQGIVTSISGGGVFVTLPNGIEARIPLSKMTDGATFVDEFDSMCFLGSKGNFDLQEEVTPDNWRELLGDDPENPTQILAKLGDKLSITFIGWDHIEGRVTAAPVAIEESEFHE